MKRVLLIIEHLGSGGAERQICGLAVSLTNAGYPCRLITYVEKQFYESYLRDNGVDYELVPELKKKRSRVINAAKYVRKYKADVVISFLPSVNMTMCLAKLFFAGKLVVSERNNNISISLRDKLQFNLYRKADAIVPNSNSQGEFIRRHFPFLAKKVHPIINFVDVNRFTPGDSIVSNERLRVVTVARFSRQKNVLIYLEVVNRIKQLGLMVHFDWFGDKKYDAEYYEMVETEYHRLDISDYLTLHDPTSIIEDVYRSADVFCLPSLTEGYPNAIVEAMSCGLPIICSNRFENPFIVEDNVNGFLFDPESIDDIVRTIQKIVSLSREERKEFGRRNRTLCLRRNSEEIFLNSYVELIEAL